MRYGVFLLKTALTVHPGTEPQLVYDSDGLKSQLILPQVVANFVDGIEE